MMKFVKFFTKMVAMYLNTLDKTQDVIRKAGGIIFNKDLNKVILVLNRLSYQKGENKWGLPKGHIEKNEKINMCAMREIKEETGLEFQLFSRHRCIKINNSYYFIIVLNTNQDIDLQPLDNNEIIFTKWFDLEEIQKLNKNYDTRLIFKESKLNKIKDIIHNQKHLLVNV